MNRVEIQTVGGNTYYLFSQADYNVDLGLSLEEAVVEYVSQALDGVITAPQYGVADSRLVQFQSPTALRTYTVQSGDSLWKISQRTYGKGLSGAGSMTPTAASSAPTTPSSPARC